jgi:cytochrome c oxidase cbb3-type subunit 2
MFESRGGIIFIAGVGFFVLAFLANGLVAILLYADKPEQVTEETISANMLQQFADLHLRYPEQFKTYIGEFRTDQQIKLCADTLRKARKLYIGEGCWHCHSQFVRPVSREVDRWGPVSRSAEYNNELQRPVMFGTRRVGPDLIRGGGRRSNDWHAAHFFNPRSVTTESVMPTYPWFFDRPADFLTRHPEEPTNPTAQARYRLIKAQPPEEPSPLLPNDRGLALIAYIQWLGSWQPHYFTLYKDPGTATSESQK